MKLLFGADLAPTVTNFELFSAGNVEALVGQSLIDVLGEADLRVFNLELPLTDSDTPIEKYGPCLRAPVSTVAGIKALGVDVMALANNHILDHGRQGLASTVNTLEREGIAHFGTGCYPTCAAPYIFESNGKRIGIYACAEHEFSIATPKKAGANPFDPLESPDHVAALKKQCDFVIVLYHGGKEYYRYPSPNLQRVCRKLVEKGADLVLCQHSHCIGCEEKYLRSTIVYGQGNFLFDRGDNEYRNSALLVQVNDDFSVSYIPICKQMNGVRLAEGEQAEKILRDFYSRSKQLEQPGYCEEMYRQLVLEQRERYLLALSGVTVRSLPMRVINRLTGQRWSGWLIRHRYRKGRLLGMRNALECETHRELILEGLSSEAMLRCKRN